MVTKRKSKTNNKAPIILSVLLLVVIVGFVIFFIFSCNRNTSADITQFKISPYLKCTIDKDEVFYNEKDSSDNLRIYFTLENVDEVSDYDKKLLDDDNIPTADQVTEEQSRELTFEQMEKINQKTILKQTGSNLGAHSISEYAQVFCMQNRKLIYDSDIERDESLRPNEDQYAILLQPKETNQFCVCYKLFDDNEVTWSFFPRQENIPELGNGVDVHFNIKGKASKEMNEKKAEEFNSVKEKQSIANYDFQDMKLHLVDGWYVDVESSSNLLLKNPKYTDAKVNITYNSSQNAEKVANEAITRLGNVELKTVQIKDYTYYMYEKKNTSIVLCLDSGVNGSFRIAVDGIDFDTVKPLLENIEKN